MYLHLSTASSHFFVRFATPNKKSWLIKGMDLDG